MTNQVNNDVIKPIEYDHEMDRFYIPVNSRYEIQTKGKGSSFRIANTYTKLRSIVLNDALHPVLEDMAKATNAEMGQLQATHKASESEINSLKERVAELQSHLSSQSLEIAHNDVTLESYAHKVAELQELLNDRQSDLDFEFNRAEQNELECNALTEVNNKLREELENTLTSLQEIKDKYEIQK